MLPATACCSTRVHASSIKAWPAWPALLWLSLGLWLGLTFSRSGAASSTGHTPCTRLGWAPAAGLAGVVSPQMMFALSPMVSVFKCCSPAASWVCTRVIGDGCGHTWYPHKCWSICFPADRPGALLLLLPSPLQLPWGQGAPCRGCEVWKREHPWVQRPALGRKGVAEGAAGHTRLVGCDGSLLQPVPCRGRKAWLSLDCAVVCMCPCALGRLPGNAEDCSG